MYRCLACAAAFTAHMPLCTSCFASHSLLPVGDRPRAAVDGEMELTDARALSQAAWKRVDLPAYPSLELRRGALVVLVGAAGAGKSTLLALMLDTLRAPSMLVSVEEPGGPSLAMRLGRLGIKKEDLLVASRATVDQLASTTRVRKLGALGIDSVQRSMFEPRDLRHLLLTLPTLEVLVATSQINRAHDIRGGEELRHEADVVLEVEALRWRVVKSRYQPQGVSGEVLRSPLVEEAEDGAH